MEKLEDLINQLMNAENIEQVLIDTTILDLPQFEQNNNCINETSSDNNQIVFPEMMPLQVLDVYICLFKFDARQ